ncbi:MAG: hypothetical protein IMY72_10600 [Bacteroidetes bacterium]|nr:hypothetical protein [Bacteroidota bacterium]
MQNFNQNIITKRFVVILKYLKLNKSIKSFSEFCRNVGLLPQSLNEIFKQKRDVPILVIHKMVIIYKIDPNILFKEKQKDEKTFINNYIQNLDINTKSPEDVIFNESDMYIKDDIIEAKEEVIRALKQTVNLQREIIENVKTIYEKIYKK